MSQLQGMRVRVNDENGAAALGALGAVPVALPFSEAYQAYSRGVVKGGVGNAIAIINFRFGEVASHQIRNVELGFPPSGIVMNKAFYEGLSDEAKEILESVSGLEGSLDIADRQYRNDLKNLEFLEDWDGYSITTLPPEEEAAWKEKIAVVAQEWAERTPNGEKILERYLEVYETAAADLQ